MLDSRTERSRENVIRPGTWAMVQQRLAALPASVKHLVVVAPVPIVYPQVPIVESSLEYLTGACAWGGWGRWGALVPIVESSLGYLTGVCDGGRGCMLAVKNGKGSIIGTNCFNAQTGSYLDIITPHFDASPTVPMPGPDSAPILYSRPLPT